MVVLDQALITNTTLEVKGQVARNPITEAAIIETQTTIEIITNKADIHIKMITIEVVTIILNRTDNMVI